MTQSTLNPLVKQLLDATHEVALEKNLISPETLTLYSDLLAEAAEYLSVSVKGRKPDSVDKMASLVGELSSDDQLGLSRLMAVETIVLNGLNNYFQNKEQLPLKTRFENIIEEAVNSGETPDKAISILKKTLDTMLVSMVFTMHPVVFHTPKARRGEQKLSSRLEGMRQIIEENDDNIMPDSYLDDFKQKLKNNISAIIHGATVTPFDQVTVASERQTEIETLERIQYHLPSVSEAWNNAVTAVAKRIDDDEMREKIEDLGLSDKRMTEMFEIRSWVRGGADADGRKFATSTVLYGDIQKDVKDKKYTGPKLDLRQNSEMHRDYISALIQRTFLEDETFRDFCEKFIDRHNVRSDPDGWLSPTESIYQQLPEAAKTEFLRQILEKGFDLGLSEIDKETINFNREYHTLYNKFLKEKRYVEDTTFQEMTREHQNEFAQRLEGIGYKLDHDGLSYKTIGNDDTGHDVFFKRRRLKIAYKTLPNGKPDIDPTTDRQREVHSLVPIQDDQKPALLDIPKRLAVISNAIRKYGSDVADRYQIANFEEAGDFYTALILFQQHGLITIEKGVVTKAKMAIQPLLETVPDMKRGKEIFQELLKDPMVRSYYKESGSAQIMLGFSDGSKSAGNFASQWQIYKTSREIQKVFEEEFADEIAEDGFTIRFLQGRGRGKDRGGTGEIGVAAKLMPHEVNKSAIFDITTQADQPMNMAASPTATQNSVGSMLLGAITARQAALIPETHDSNERNAAYEKIMDFIADKAEEVFVQSVKRNPKALEFVDGTPLNAERTSRSKKRAATTKGNWDSRRAIGVEYGFNMGKLPAHDVGLKAGINAFLESGIELPDGKGNLVSGMDALRTMYDEHTFFRAQIDVRSSAIKEQYDPAMARMYGRLSGTEEFVESAIGELKGLADYLRDISGKSTHVERLKPQNEERNPLQTVSIVAHSIIAAHGGKMPNREHHPEEAKIVKNASFVIAQRFAHPDISGKLRQNADEITPPAQGK